MVTVGELFIFSVGTYLKMTKLTEKGEFHKKHDFIKKIKTTNAKKILEFLKII